MNCQEAELSFSARIDGELPAGDSAALDAHFAECEACRRMAAEMEVQDAALLRAFVPRQQAAGELANRVAAAIEHDASAGSASPATVSESLRAIRIPNPASTTNPHSARSSRFHLRHWASWFTAAAAGFIGALLIIKPPGPSPVVVQPPSAIPAGKLAHVPFSMLPYACTTQPDLQMMMCRQDELLLLKPGDDPEVLARAGQLFTRISLDRRLAAAPNEAEQVFRAHGPAWCSATVCYLRTQPRERDRDTRRTAALLLADLAVPTSIPDLIDLLNDEETEVRFHSAAALRRLTGQTLGYSPEVCAAANDRSPSVAWREWWARNKSIWQTGK